MSLRASAVAQALLKVASARAVAKGLGHAIRGTASAAKAAVSGAGELGAGVAEGMGGNPVIGKVIGSGAAIGAGAVGAGKTKRKVDEWRYRNGMY